MSSKKQVVAAVAALTTSVDWDNSQLDLQAIIQAANQGKLGRSLTEWLVGNKWDVGQVARVVKPKPIPLILEFISTIVVNATAGKLVAKEKFVRDTGRKAKVKIGYLNDHFISWFLNGDGKTEDPISEQTLRYHKLRQSSVDGPIIAELGGAEKSETTLSEMFSLMEKQGTGEDGVLLNNGYANIFYIRDNAGVLRAVRVYWSVDGWYVGARSVEDPRRWVGGYQVFSRNSVLESSETSAPAPTA